MSISPKIEISERTIIFAVFFILSLWFAVRILDIILILFVSVILMSAFKPLVDRLERFRLPRSASIVLVYLFLWVFVGIVLAGLVPALIDQTRRLINLFTQVIVNNHYLSQNQQEITRQLLSGMGSIPTDVIRLVTGLFGNILNVVTTTVISFYLLLERQNLDKILEGFLGSRRSQKVEKVISDVETRLGGWIRGELMLMVCVGVMTYVGLRILGLETALPLAILAGMLEIIPNIGPTVAAIPAVIIALTIHPLTAISTVAMYVLVQFLENNFLVPQIMSKTTGINPLISIISLMIGFRLAGTSGAILAIPLVLVIHTISPHFLVPPDIDKEK